MATFKRASRKQLKLRMAIDGPSGSGKSMTGLRLAFALAAHEAAKQNREPRVAVIDSENGSISKYEGDAPDGTPFHFDVAELTTFSPSEYEATIKEAGRAGVDVILIDSLSHAWIGKDGALELKDKRGGNSFTAWKDITPMHSAMVESILRSPCHVIATMRSKTEHILEERIDDRGRKMQVPVKVGMAPQQRPGMEYEFDIYGSMDWSHIMTISKSRCSAVDGVVVVKPGAAWMAAVIRWLEDGERVEFQKPAAVAAGEQVATIAALLTELGFSVETAKKGLPKAYGVTEYWQLTVDQASDLIDKLERQRKAKAIQQPAENPKDEPPPSAPPASATVPTQPPAPSGGANGQSPPVQQQQSPTTANEHIYQTRADNAAPPSPPPKESSLLPSVEADGTPSTATGSISQATLDKILALLKLLKIGWDAAISRVKELFGAATWEQLSEAQARGLVTTLEGKANDAGLALPWSVVSQSVTPTPEPAPRSNGNGTDSHASTARGSASPAAIAEIHRLLGTFKIALDDAQTRLPEKCPGVTRWEDLSAAQAEKITADLNAAAAELAET
jgi:hypothetical protein